MSVNWISLLGLDTLVARWRESLNEAATAAEDRADLAQLEWTQFRDRLILMAGLVVVTLGLTIVAMIMLSLALLVTFWDSDHRTTVAWCIGAGWGLVWLGFAGAAFSVMRRLGNPFSLTRSELAADWRALKKRL